MGRRSTKTTKTGKFMNPTDQWRKQCRKKELKKNKVQRTVVREAVLKSKNPQQILAEIEEIEKMEIEAGSEEPPNDKGLKEKKRKLHETLSRLVNYYERDDYNSAQQVKKLIVDSEKRRRDMTTVYNSYRTARSQYSDSDIPLPEGPSLDDDNDDPSLKHTDEHSSIPPGLIPPGPPPGPPPDIVFPKAIVARPPRAVRFVEDDDENSEEEQDDESDDGEEEEEEDEEKTDDQDEDNDQSTETQSRPEQPLLQPPGPPPGPPPGMQQYNRTPAPLFPPTPLGRYVPPPSFVQPRPLLSQSSPHIQSSAIISTYPVKHQTQPDKQSVTISAQPQIRNVQAEVTKFLPTSLRVRRDQPKAVKSKVRGPTGNVQSSTKPVSDTVTTGVRGDAYEAFMKEMQGLL